MTRVALALALTLALASPASALSLVVRDDLRLVWVETPPGVGVPTFADQGVWSGEVLGAARQDSSIDASLSSPGMGGSGSAHDIYGAGYFSFSTFSVQFEIFEPAHYGLSGLIEVGSPGPATASASEVVVSLCPGDYCLPQDALFFDEVSPDGGTLHRDLVHAGILGPGSYQMFARAYSDTTAESRFSFYLSLSDVPEPELAALALVAVALLALRSTPR